MKASLPKSSLKPSHKPSSKDFLEEVSRYCCNQLTLYKFNRSTLDIDEKYREGRITALNYVADLTFYFMQREKHIAGDFLCELDRQLEAIETLKSPNYTQGIRDSINALHQEIDKFSLC